MKTASAGLITLLATARQFVMWEVYTITLVDGTVLTWTQGDVAGAAARSTTTGNAVTLTG